MRFLEELEKKVLHLIVKNQEMQAKLEAAVKENQNLREQIVQFEASLLKESSAIQSLAQEKAALVHGIEELLNSINTLENAQ